MEFHDASNIFPLMGSEEYRALVDDIRVNGVREPIWTHEGKIIDGRNRYRACKELGLEPPLREWGRDGDSLVDFVVSLNLHRRHLSASQKAAIAADLEPWYAAEAKKRQVRLAGSRPNNSPDLVEKFPQGPTGKARDAAAAAVGANPHYVSDVKRIAQVAPAIVERIRTGEVSVTEAKRQVRQQEIREAPPLPDDKYRVIYADPPWKYGSSGMDDYGPAERHYPAMTITELCALPVRDLAAPDAVLFLWATSPLLEECFAVIRAWGFNYKASFIWDKVKHNWGHYNSVRHELLLVCTRGSCMPDVSELHDSVVSIERSDTHSEKPAYFRELIDTLYPHGKRIELFARSAQDGWEVWGNECDTTTASALRHPERH